jgi:hypothetical protein
MQEAADEVVVHGDRWVVAVDDARRPTKSPGPLGTVR